MIQTSASGGECLGPVWTAANGEAYHYTVPVGQTGATLTATIRVPAFLLRFTYSGTAGRNTATLTATNCVPARLQFQCADGTPRDVYLVSRSLAGTLTSATSLQGIATESWNVFVTGTTTNSLGVLTVGPAFRA